MILQHFERGAKLNDSSNRYQHTCKACGEKFPKGRIDSLTTHLVKKCPAITLRDRQKALLELNGLNNIPDLANAPPGQNGEVQINGPTVELPVGIGNRNWTALETLAEVSNVGLPFNSLPCPQSTLYLHICPQYIAPISSAVYIYFEVILGQEILTPWPSRFHAKLVRMRTMMTVPPTRKVQPMEVAKRHEPTVLSYKNNTHWTTRLFPMSIAHRGRRNVCRSSLHNIHSQKLVLKTCANT